MLLGFVLLFGYALVVWLVFFKFKWMQFNIVWGIVSVSVGLHLLLIFLIGLRFVTPYATEAKVVQHTIQLIPRLTEPTLVTAVLVEPNVPVKKGTPLFQFDRRPYEFKVRQLEATLVQAKQDVKVMQADIVAAAARVKKLQADLVFARYQAQLSTGLSAKGAGPEEDAQKWTAQVAASEAAIKEAQADLSRATLKYQSQVDGVNTTVAATQAELDLYWSNELARMIQLSIFAFLVGGAALSAAYYDLYLIVFGLSAVLVDYVRREVRGLNKARVPTWRADKVQEGAGATSGRQAS